MNTTKHSKTKLQITPLVICFTVLVFAACRPSTHNAVGTEETTIDRVQKSFTKSIEEARNQNFDPEKIERLKEAHQVAITKLRKAYQDGRLEAEQDLKRGKMVLKRFGFPPPWLGRAEELLLDRYNVELRTVGGCVMSTEEDESVRGYNDVSQQLIAKKFEPNILDKIFSEVQKKYEMENRTKLPREKSLL